MTLLSDRIRQVETRQQPTERARQGEDGGCIACNQAVATHFDTQGRWLGCSEADADTAFVLVPVRTRNAAATPPPSDQAPPRQRAFRRARYFLTEAEPAQLTAQRRKVYTALVKSGDAGATAAELGAATGLDHGQVQGIVGWLRERGYVVAADATE
jgi:hypothetical protein